VSRSLRIDPKDAAPIWRQIEEGMRRLVASGALAFGMMARLLIVLVVLLALAASDRDAGLAAALTYGAAYTAELGLSLFGYYAQEPPA